MLIESFAKNALQAEISFSLFSFRSPPMDEMSVGMEGRRKKDEFRKE